MNYIYNIIIYIIIYIMNCIWAEGSERRRERT